MVSILFFHFFPEIPSEIQVIEAVLALHFIGPCREATSILPTWPFFIFESVTVVPFVLLDYMALDCW